MALHHTCYSSEKEANKLHSGKLINQDPGWWDEGQLYNKYLYDIIVITLNLSPLSLVCNNNDITIVLVIYNYNLSIIHYTVLHDKSTL